MATRKKKPAKAIVTPKNRKALLKVLLAGVREHGYVPVSRKLKVSTTSVLAVLVGGVGRPGTEAVVLERFAKLIKRKAA